MFVVLIIRLLRKREAILGEKIRATVSFFLGSGVAEFLMLLQLRQGILRCGVERELYGASPHFSSGDDQRHIQQRTAI